MPAAGHSHVWVVTPAYNEASAIGSAVAGVREVVTNVVVVDDGSADDTADVASRAGAAVLRHRINLGQGAALQTGIEYAVGRGAEILVTFDADGQMDPNDINVLLAAMHDDVDVVLGSRFLGHIDGASQFRRLFLKTAVFVSNVLSGARYTDAHCGLRAFRAAVAPKLEITHDGMAHASELLAKIRRNKLAVVEVPVTIRYTEYSQRKGQSALNAVKILFDLFVR